MRGQHSGRNSNDHADRKREEGELQRGRITLEDDPAHGCLKFEGLSEIAMRQRAEVVAVLHEQRLVETQGVAQAHDFARGRSLAKHLFDGISRNDMNQQKDKREDEP